MSSYTYTIAYESCSTDSQSNTCATNCCATTSGGILDSVQSCTNDPNLCVNGTSTTIQTQKCGMDLSENKCFEQCCATYTTGDNSYMNCQAGMFCKGLNPRALTLANYQNHKTEIQSALTEMPTVNTNGKIALGVLGGVTALLIIVLVLLLWVLHKQKQKYNEYIEGHVKNAGSNEKVYLIEEGHVNK